MEKGKYSKGAIFGLFLLGTAAGCMNKTTVLADTTKQDVLALESSGGSNVEASESSDKSVVTNLADTNWDSIGETIGTLIKSSVDTETEENTEMVVKMGSQTSVPLKIMKQIAGSQIRLVLVMEKYTWSITGTDVDATECEELMETKTELDFSVTADETIFADEKLQKRMDAMLILKKYQVKGITSYSFFSGEEMPCAATLTVSVGEKWENQYLYVTKFNSATYEMTPIAYDKIGEENTLTFSVEEGGTYLITNANPVRPFIGKYVSIVKGESLNFTDKITNLTGKERIYYSSSNEDVAVVNEDGTVQANKKGETLITIKIVQGNRCFVYKTTLLTEDRLSYMD